MLCKALWDKLFVKNVQYKLSRLALPCPPRLLMVNMRWIRWAVRDQTSSSSRQSALREKRSGTTLRTLRPWYQSHNRPPHQPGTFACCQKSGRSLLSRSRVGIGVQTLLLFFFKSYVFTSFIPASFIHLPAHGTGDGNWPCGYNLFSWIKFSKVQIFKSTL